LLTSIYTTSMSISSAVAFGISIPLANDLGWRNSLAVWGFITVIALVLWLPQLFRNNVPRQNQKPTCSASSVWRSPLAWYIAMFMGLQSGLFFSLIAWLPEILRNSGLSAAMTGWMLSLYQVVTVPAGFFAPIIAARFRNQRGATLIVCMLYFIGLGGLLLDGNASLLTIALILLALGSGSCFSLALTFIGLRSTDQKQAAALSGMSQFVGYLMAAGGPFLIGFLYDYTRSWLLSILFLLLNVLGMVYFGFKAGSNRMIIQEESNH
jgi:MFS transporter, CP family, cyanate transporter